MSLTVADKLEKQSLELFETMELHSHGLRRIATDPASIESATLSIGKDFEKLKASLQEAFTIYDGDRFFIPDLEALKQFAKDNRLNSRNFLCGVNPGPEGFMNIINYGSGRISNINALANLPSLLMIAFESNNIQDLSPLSNLRKLKHIYLSSNNIEDLTPLAKIQSIELLTLALNLIKDVSALGSLVNLKELNLSNNDVKDLTPLRTCVSLRKLEFEYHEDLDLTFLKDLNNLQDLVVGGKLREIKANPTLQKLEKKGLSIRSDSRF